MRLPYKIEHLEHKWAIQSDTPWKNWSKSRKWAKKARARIWRRWSKRNLNEDSNNPKFNTYYGWEY